VFWATAPPAESSAMDDTANTQIRNNTTKRIIKRGEKRAKRTFCWRDESWREARVVSFGEMAAVQHSAHTKSAVHAPTYEYNHTK
jgi:hypothetical protein